MTTIEQSPKPTVLVVEDDAATRRLVRLSLELDGALVIEAESLEGARPHLHDALNGVVLDRELPDGDGLDLLPDLQTNQPGVPIVVFSNVEDRREPSSVRRVEKGDLAGLIDALDLTASTPAPRRLAVIDLVRGEQEALAADWRELCRWDPMLPPDSQPPIAPALIAAVGDALEHPQPLGWGADPAVVEVTEVYAGSVGAVDVVIGQLVCLREALRRRIAGRIPSDEVTETQARIQMVIDRAIGIAANHAADRLRQEAYVDALTGLPNRRALERDLRREMGRAGRYGRGFSVVVLDVDGLKRTNDTAGHAAGDGLLRALAGALLDALRSADSAYRMGGDEFALLLPETVGHPVERVIDRVVSSGAPAFSWGLATYPEDSDDPSSLVDLADRRLYEQRRITRGSTQP